MKKIRLFIVAISPLFISCLNNKNDMITIVNCNDILGKPEYMFFKTENKGYMFNYKGNLYSNASIMIYKTINGGKDWEQIHYQDGYRFYGYAKLYNNAIFGNIKSLEDVEKNNLFKLDLITHEFKLLDFNIDAIGNMWIKNDSIYLSFYNKPHDYILTTDTNFLSYSKTPFSYVPKKNGVISDNTSTYFITWKNKLVIETDNHYKEIDIKDPECVTLIDKGKLLIATNEHDNRINFISYDVKLGKFEKLHTFKNYSIINHLQSNEKVIVGFIGNIKGMFVDYDLIYSTDKGQTWHIQKLKEKNLITPNCLVDNILYIYSGRKLQKIQLTQ